MPEEPAGAVSRRSALAAVLVATVAAGAEAQQAPPPSPATSPLRIVLHVSDPDGWAPALSNVRNLTAQHPDVKLRLVVDGTGIYMMAGVSDLTPEFARFAAAGVEFQACHNALRERKIDPRSVPAGVKVVPSGALALAESQRAGYVYVKP